MPLPLEHFVIASSVILFFFYNVFTFTSGYYYCGYKPRLPKSLCSTLFPLLNTTVIFCLLYLQTSVFTELLLFSALITLEYRLAYRASNISIAFSSNIVSFFNMFLIQTTISIVSLFSGANISMMDVYWTPALFYPSLSAACAAGVACHLISRRLVSNRRPRMLIENQKALRFLTICLVGFNIYMLLSCLSMFMDNMPQLFSVYFAATHIVLLCVFFFIMDYGIKDCYLTDLSTRSSVYEQQLQRQLLHYKSYEKYTDSLRIFRHDYKQMMRTVNNLLDTGQTDQARRLIAQINDHMQNNLQVHQKYSNNYLVDAILQDTANLCEEKHIDFFAQVYLPNGIHCSDINACRIATNLTNNAVEACESITDPYIARYIRLTSSQHADWVTITVENAFEGKVRFDEEGLPLSTKEHTDSHGMGLRSVHELIEQIGGLMLIDADSKKNVFTVRLHLKDRNASREPSDGVQKQALSK